MQAEVKKPFMQKYLSRLGISQTNSLSLRLGDVLWPTINFDLLTTETTTQTTTGTGTSRTDTYIVPNGKIWTLRHSNCTRATAGTIQILVKGTNSGATGEEWYPATSGTSLQTEYYGLRLKGGDLISFVFGAGTSGTLTSVLFYEETDASS